MPSEPDPGNVPSVFFADKPAKTKPRVVPSVASAIVQLQGLPPLGDTPWGTTTNEIDPLSLFAPEDPANNAREAQELTSASYRTREEPLTPETRAAAAIPQIDSLDLDAFLRETELAVMQSKDEAASLQTDLEVDQNAGERVAALTALAEEVTRSASLFEAQRRTIASGLAEATRVAEVVSSLEGRVTKLAEKDQPLGHAEEVVGRLEQRAAEAAAQLEQIAKTKGELERQLANFQQRLHTLTESARNQVDELADQRDEAHVVMRVRTRKVMPLIRRSAVIGGVAALVLIGLIGMPALNNQLQTRTTPTTTGQLSALPAPPPVLRSRLLNLEAFAIPAVQTKKMPARMSAKERARAARFTKEPTPPPEIVGVVAVQSDPVRAPKATAKRPAKERPIEARPVRNQAPLQEFIGGLAVRSEPAGAAVFVNRQPVGETPLQLTGLRAGSHTVWIEREGYQRWTAAVLVSADKQTQVSANLQPNRDR